MNSEKEFPENQSDNSGYDSSEVDDFIKQLEAKEKDLGVSSDLVVEIEESDISEADSLDLLRFLQDYEENSMAQRAATERPVTDYQPFNEKFEPAQHSEKTSSVQNNGADFKQLQEKIAQLETERAEMSEAARRHKTDLENYRKRSERERNEMMGNALGNVANQLLPVIDNLARALTTNVSDESSKEFKQFRDGIEMVNQQFNDVLTEMGIEPIKSVGEIFDPHLHEAVAAEQTDEFPPHTVVAELLRGFRLGDKVIRHSLVKVSTS